MKKSVFIASGLILASCSSYHVNKVVKDVSLKDKEVGFYYYLPKKQYQFTVEYEQVSVSPGPFYTQKDSANFVKELENIDFPVSYYTSKETSYKIKSVKMEEMVIADMENNSYYVSLHGRNNLFVSKKMKASFTGSGILTGTSSEFQNNSVDYGFALLNGSINLASTAMGFTADVASAEAIASNDLGKLKTIVQKIVDLTNAEEELLESKGAAASYTQGNLSVQLNGIQQERKKLLDLIKGDKTTTTKTMVFTVDPKIGDNIVFNFDKKNGFKSTTSPFTLTLTALNSTQMLGSYKNLGSTDARKKGIHYRIPVQCQFELKDKDGTVHFNTIGLVPQFGEVACLPNRVGAFKSVLDFKLDESTGALVSFEGNSDELDKDKIKGYIDEIAGYPSKFKKEEVSEDPYAERDKQLKDLEYEIKLLELQLLHDSLSGRQQ